MDKKAQEKALKELEEILDGVLANVKTLCLVHIAQGMIAETPAQQIMLALAEIAKGEPNVEVVGQTPDQGGNETIH